MAPAIPRRSFFAILAVAAAMPSCTPPHPKRGTTYRVPSSIDSTGSSDTTAALTDWIASVPDGTADNPSVLQFSGGSYRIDSALHLTSRAQLTFALNGDTTFQWNAPRGASLRLLWFTTCTGITVRYGTLRGTYAYPPKGDALVPAYQHMHAIEADASSVTVAHMTISGFYGDGVDFTNEAGTRAASSGKVTSCHIRQVGRNAVSAVAADGVTVSRCHIQQTGYWGVDVEPNAAQAAPCRNVAVIGNTFGSQGGTLSRRWFGIEPNACVCNVACVRNRVLRRDPSVWVNYDGQRELSAKFRPQNITFGSNFCDTPAAELHPFMVFGTDTLRGNRDAIKPASGGTIFGLSGVTGWSGNDSRTVVVPTA
jgi:hypothetical protein